MLSILSHGGPANRATDGARVPHFRWEGLQDAVSESAMGPSFLDQCTAVEAGLQLNVRFI